VSSSVAGEPAFLAALRERRQQERREKLLESVLEMSTAARFRERDEAAFRRIFDSVWEQVQAGALTESIAVGKILDRIYAQRTPTPGKRAFPQEAASRGVPVGPPALAAAAFSRAPVSPAETAPDDAAAEVLRPALVPVLPREGSVPAQMAERAAEALSSPVAATVRLPAILDNWVGQGLTAHRIFRDLQKTSDLRDQVRRWAKTSSGSGVDVQYLFILHVLNGVTTFTADEEVVTVPVPLIPKMGFAEFEMLIQAGKAAGAHNIDPRIWGVIGGVYTFLKNWLAPELKQP